MAPKSADMAPKSADMAPKSADAQSESVDVDASLVGMHCKAWTEKILRRKWPQWPETGVGVAQMPIRWRLATFAHQQF
jgi:hypothetical protein